MAIAASLSLSELVKNDMSNPTLFVNELNRNLYGNVNDIDSSVAQTAVEMFIEYMKSVVSKPPHNWYAGSWGHKNYYSINGRTFGYYRDAGKNIKLGGIQDMVASEGMELYMRAKSDKPVEILAFPSVGVEFNDIQFPFKRKNEFQYGEPNITKDFSNAGIGSVLVEIELKFRDINQELAEIAKGTLHKTDTLMYDSIEDYLRRH